jgi:hypothetical protein
MDWRFEVFEIRFFKHQTNDILFGLKSFCIAKCQFWRFKDFIYNKKITMYLKINDLPRLVNKKQIHGILLTYNCGISVL